ncbi:MAG: hypothetical protein R6U96_01730 [Promethearchaeia archaeon]
MSEENLFEILINQLDFDITEYLVTKEDQLTDFQKDVIENATFILEDNIIGEVKRFGGNVKANKDKFDKFVENAKTELEKEKYENSKRHLKKLLKNYVKSLQDFIQKTCIAVVPVKELPWENLVFRTVPRIIIEGKKTKLMDSPIAYCGDIKCIISKPIVYGKLKDAEPLFAPYMGGIDLGGYELDSSEQIAEKSQIIPYVHALLYDTIDSTVTKNNLVKYHENYQRHGEPICDFLMKDQELLQVMKKITSSLESGRTTGSMAVCGLALPSESDGKSLVLCTDESGESDRFSKCFESLLRFSATCCEAPSTRKPGVSTSALGQSQSAPQQTTEAGGTSSYPTSSQQPSQPGQSSTVQTPGGNELKVWNEEELQEQAQNRQGGVPSDMESWDKESLQNLAEERGSGIPEGMEVWSEEELEELKKKRQGQELNIPEWQEEGNLRECLNCGYGLRKGWTKCPICETPVGETSVSSSEGDRTSTEEDSEPSTGEQPAPSETIPEPEPLPEPEKKTEEDDTDISQQDKQTDSE